MTQQQQKQQTTDQDDARTFQLTPAEVGTLTTAAEWRRLRILRAEESAARYAMPASHRTPTGAVVIAPPRFDAKAGKATREHYALDLVNRTCTCADYAGRLEALNAKLDAIRDRIARRYPDLTPERLNALVPPCYCKHAYVRAAILRAERAAARVAAEEANETAAAIHAPEAVTVLRSFARAAVLPLCALCASERRLIRHEGEPHVYCPKCHDAAPITERAAAVLHAAGIR